MWAGSLARNSSLPVGRVAPFCLRAAIGSVDNGRRGFSSDDYRSGNGPPYGGRGGRGGGRGRGGREPPRQEGSAGRGAPKPSFSDRFLAPAERGELKNHQSTMPRHIGRKAKGHGIRRADDSFPNDGEEELEVLRLDDEEDVEKVAPIRKTGSIANNSPIEDLPPHERRMIDEFMHDYRVLISTDEVEKYYWNERDYDFEEETKKAQIFAKLVEQATPDEDGNLVLTVDNETFELFESATEEAPVVEKKEQQQQQQQGQFMSPADDPVFQFVPEMMQIKGLNKPPPEDYDRVLPLKLSGPTIYDFVESMMNHPSKYGELRWEAPNEERDRQPFAKIPPGRRNPPLEFLKAHKRFLYVWGLPSCLADGQPIDLENPLHYAEIQMLVGACFDVSTEQVSVASSSSAFIGFKDINDQKFALAVGPMMKDIQSPVIISKYQPNADFQLANDHADALVLLENLPLGLTPTLLAVSIFPPDSEVGEIYGPLSSDRIVMLSPSSAVVAMASSELADNAITSSLVKERMFELGQHHIRFAKARRELVYTGTHGGPDGTDRLRKLGPRLIVDGDMPTKGFFTSHASAIFLRELDPSLTKGDIAAFFQPFCSVTRDVEGSTEFVTCREGLPTGRAFVGFDELGEAEAALEALRQDGGHISGLGSGLVMADLVQEPRQPNKKRPTRSEDELLDSLNNWQQHVDPADLQELLDHNISIEALDETFRAIRYHNSTFASMYQAMRSETLNPEKDSGGMFKDLVQTYIATLKECLSTPENPGAIYESLHFPDEPFSVEIFDEEPARQDELRKRREVP